MDGTPQEKLAHAYHLVHHEHGDKWPTCPGCTAAVEALIEHLPPGVSIVDLSIDGVYFDPLSSAYMKGMAAGVKMEREKARGHIEELAELEHDQWMAWAKVIMAHEPGLSSDRFTRWQSLFVPYQELAHDAKEQDREWARKVLAILDRQ